MANFRVYHKNWKNGEFLGGCLHCQEKNWKFYLSKLKIIAKVFGKKRLNFTKKIIAKKKDNPSINK
jgi:hypothetical protein